MTDKKAVIEQIREAFGDNEFPGDDYLQGSFEGSEPYEEIEVFKGRDNWQDMDADLLDAHYVVLSFFSEAALRFFLPAYLLADLNDELETADPLFTLVHGFSDRAVSRPTGTGDLVLKIGKSAFVNPRRYGAATFFDYARWRLSVFAREEARAIVGYLTYRRDSDPDRTDAEEIDGALNLFWLERAQDAPSVDSLGRYLVEEEEYLAAIGSDAICGS